jgi:hypothetical protein
MSIGTAIQAATERSKARRAAALAARTKRASKRTERKEIRGKRKEGRKKSRAAVKEIRSKDKPGAARRGLVLATKAFHKVDKEGKPGGYKAFGKFTGSKRAKRIGEAVKRQKARREAREDRQKARKERIAARKADRNKE